MKNIFLVIGLLISFYTFSQNNAIKTTTIAVKGNCKQCKKRIENAADIKGVKISNWDEEKQVLTVTYNSEKVTLAQIEQAVVKSGHDAGTSKAADVAYKKLPTCCQYKDHACDDKKK
jgi:mercuric ion binding protein